MERTPKLSAAKGVTCINLSAFTCCSIYISIKRMAIKVKKDSYMDL
ncbi:MAG: hypothetical protein LBI09_01405 [Nitrososphaerota archaeon]|nr:hypothetical protein [Nitrososphaerota archaeon]